MDIPSFIFSVVDKGQLQVLAYMCGANLVMGTVGALVRGDFQIAKLKDFWRTIGLVFVAYTTVAIAAKGLADFAPLVTAVYLALIGGLSVKLINNLKDWGLPIPEKLQKFLGK